MNQAHTYDLAFVSPKRRPKRTAPEIVFIIHEKCLPEMIDRLQHITTICSEYIDDYLRTDKTSFSLPIPDLFGNREFGFAKCGYWTTDNDKVHLHLQLRPYPWTHYCALTIWVLTGVLGAPFTVLSSNRPQNIQLVTCAKLGRSGGYGHALGGWISEDIIKWLSKYAKSNIRPMGIIEQSAPMHPEVTRAMQAAAGAMITSSKNGYPASPRAIYGWIRDSGAFAMNCFGDACDLNVYPDQFLAEGCEMVDLGCHNLDTSDQQLTLLAGLAKLAELARSDSS